MNVAGRIRIDNTNSLYTEKLYATSNPTLLENSKKGKYTETRGEERQTYGDVMLNISKTFKEKFALDAHIGASIKDNRFDELSVYGPIAGAPNIFNVVNLDKEPEENAENRLARANAVVFLLPGTGLEVATVRNDDRT